MIQTIQSLNVLIRNLVQLSLWYHNRGEKKLSEVFREVCVFNFNRFYWVKTLLLTQDVNAEIRKEAAVSFLGRHKSELVCSCIACIRLYWIGPCQVQQRWRSRAQTQHEGGSRVFYLLHAGGVVSASFDLF
jgi:hypothetical protein